MRHLLEMAGPKRAPFLSIRKGSALLLGAWILIAAGGGRSLAETTRQSLPAPVVNPHSTEICMNSRISYHGGWSGAATDQMLANVLHATAQASILGAPPVVYAATPTGVYLYDPASNSLITHKAGDWRSDATAAFEVGVAADNTIDAGAAMQLAQLESVALWSGTASQLASCPRASATTYANAHWDPTNPIDIVVSFGVRAVAGLTTTLVATSSDGSLPNPRTDGTVYMDTALADIAYGATFDAEALALPEVSQLLWASYGCSNHNASGKAGLVCPSAVANYYLTRRIYVVGPDGVYRFHNRRPPGTDATTRDHRIELVRSGDSRQALRGGVSGLPDASHYLVICVGTTGAWQELEVGFAAMGAVLEASTMGLQGHLVSGLVPGQQDAVRNATGIPSSDLPMAIVSLGHPSGASGVIPGSGGAGRGLGLSIETSTGRVMIRYRAPMDGAIDLSVFDCQGHRVRDLVSQEQTVGAHDVSWDYFDDRGKTVSSGVYFCCLKAGGLVESARIVVVR